MAGSVVNIRSLNEVQKGLKRGKLPPHHPVTFVLIMTCFMRDANMHIEAETARKATVKWRGKIVDKYEFELKEQGPYSHPVYWHISEFGLMSSHPDNGYGDFLSRLGKALVSTNKEIHVHSQNALSELNKTWKNRMR